MLLVELSTLTSVTVIPGDEPIAGMPAQHGLPLLNVGNKLVNNITLMGQSVVVVVFPWVRGNWCCSAMAAIVCY